MKTPRHLESYAAEIIIEKKQSDISGELEVCSLNGRYVLHARNANYSYDTLHHLFQKAFRHFSVRKRKIKKVLVLGFGAGSVASILCNELHLDPNITGIEADPAVISLASKYFELGQFKNLQLRNEYAEEFVRNCKERFDLIVHDVFVEKEVPSQLIREDYIEALVKITSPGGMGFYNFIAEYRAQVQDFEQLLDYFSDHDINLYQRNFSTSNRMLVWEKK